MPLTKVWLPFASKLTRITSLPLPASMVIAPEVLLMLITSLVPFTTGSSSPVLR